MADIEVRLAREEDREAVLAFCATTWEWGDYIEHVWDEWLHDAAGALFVATADGKPVALSHLVMLNATDAWLEGMRVDPAYRQQGIGKAISGETLLEAMRRGATRARLITESTNTASITLAEGNFMRRVGAYAPYKGSVLELAAKQPSGLTKLQTARPAELDEIIDYLNASNNFPVSGGIYYAGFTAYTIDGALLQAKIEAGQVYTLRRWERLDGLAIAEPREGRYGAQLSLGYIDGLTGETFGMIAYALRRQAALLELDQVYAHVPDMMMVRDAFSGAEYEWDGHIYNTYERGLT